MGMAGLMGTLFFISSIGVRKTHKQYLPNLTLATHTSLISTVKKPTEMDQNIRTYHYSAQALPTGPAPCSAQTAPRALRPSQRNTAPAVSSLDSPITLGVSHLQ